MRAAYDRIYYDLRDAITGGEYRYKDFLPSEGILTAKYGCAHNTVRKALSLLASQGYVQAIHGKGVRVIFQSTPYLTESMKPFEARGFNSFTHEDSSEGCTISVLSNETVTVDENMASHFGFELESEIIVVERTRKLDDTVIEWETCYLRRGSMNNPKSSDVESPFPTLISSSGERLVTAKMQVTIEPTNERDVTVLENPELTTVVVVRQAFFDHDGMVCEVSEVRRAPEAFALLHTTIRSKLD